MDVKIKPINRVNVVDKIVKRITDLIMDGTFKAGDKLPSEYELMEALGISRNSLREAMKILAAMGIVEIRVGDGTYICSETSPVMIDTAVYGVIAHLSNNDELMEFRKRMDESILYSAMASITEEEIQALRDNIAEFRKAEAEGRYGELKKYDLEFHYMLIDSVKNPYYSRLMKGVYNIFEYYIMQAVSADDFSRRKSKTADFHSALVDCVEKKDIAGVKAAVELSLSGTDIDPKAHEE